MMTANQITAFAIVELGAQVPIDFYMQMSVNDDLFEEIIESWNKKNDREALYYANLMAQMARVIGGNKNAVATDYYTPKSKALKPKPVTQEDIKAKVIGIFTKYRATQEAQ